MKFKSHLKNSIASVLIVGTLMAPVQGMAASSTATSVGTSAGTGAATSATTSALTSGLSGIGSGLLTGAASGAASALLTKVVGAGWAQIIGSSIGAAATWLCTDFIMTKAINIDAAQVALEYLLYNEMKNVTDKWKPKPKDSYEEAAKSNEDGQEVQTDTVDKANEAVETEEERQWDFEVQVLQNVGIEALSLSNVADIAGGRESVLENLSQLKADGTLDTDIDQEKNKIIKEKQRQNYQWMSTAGVARAQLGLETVNQAAADAEGSGASIASQVTDDTSGDSDIFTATAGAEVANTSEEIGLKDWLGRSTSTARGMRVQTLMNLELAQRVNLANALQGNIISIVAAGALKKAPRVIKTSTDN